MRMSKKYIEDHTELNKCFYKKPRACVKFTLTRDEEQKRFVLTEEYNWFARKILSVLLIIPSWLLLGFSEGFPCAWRQTMDGFKEWWFNWNKRGLFAFDSDLDDSKITETTMMRYHLMQKYWNTHCRKVRDKVYPKI